MVSITLASITKALRSPRYVFDSEAKLKAAANKQYKEVEKIRKRPKAKFAYLTVTFPRNSTYLNRSARAVLEGEYVDGASFKFSATASGGGYDKTAKAISNVLDKAAQQNLLAKRTLPKKARQGLPGYSIPSYGEMWDGDMFEYVGPDLGLKVEKIRSNNKERIYKVIWK